METVSLSILNLRTNQEIALATNQVFLNTKPDFQRDYEAWNDELKTRFIESILLNRATNPIWTIYNEEDNSEEILDGMHRTTTALLFINDKFPIVGKYLISLDKELYDKKYCKDLSSEDKTRVRNYNFLFNKLDSSYRKDFSKLKNMYEVLNRSSRTLNDYEYNKVLLKPFYDIISANKKLFLETKFFKKKDTRGNIDTQIIEMLVLTYDMPKYWSSISSMKDDWIKDHLGEEIDVINDSIKQNESIFNDKLVLMSKIIKDFYDRKLISQDAKVFNKFFLPYKLLVSRCCALIEKYPVFNRLCDNIVNAVTSEIFIDDIEKKLNCNSRNAQFQKRIIELVDGIIISEMEKSKCARKFSKKIIQQKLNDQNHMCTICDKTISDGDDYEGDHIIPWTAGGMTDYDNLQVIHKRCHQLKC